MKFHEIQSRQSWVLSWSEFIESYNCGSFRRPWKFFTYASICPLSVLGSGCRKRCFCRLAFSAVSLKGLVDQTDAHGQNKNAQDAYNCNFKSIRFLFISTSSFLIFHLDMLPSTALVISYNLLHGLLNSQPSALTVISIFLIQRYSPLIEIPYGVPFSMATPLVFMLLSRFNTVWSRTLEINDAAVPFQMLDGFGIIDSASPCGNDRVFNIQLQQNSFFCLFEVPPMPCSSMICCSGFCSRSQIQSVRSSTKFMRMVWQEQPCNILLCRRQHADQYDVFHSNSPFMALSTWI